MGERPAPEIEVIHPEVEILPQDHPEVGSASGASQVWVTLDSHGGTRRVYVAKPGPIATLLMLIAFGVLLTISVVLTLGLLAIFLGISAVAIAGLFLFALCRWALNRLRPNR
jgi:hypothetical protein